MVARRNVLAGGGLLVVLMAITFIPFASLFTTALHPSGTYPKGLEWPSHPHWGNFVDAFHSANMGAIFKSSVLDRSRCRARVGGDRDDGGLCDRPPSDPRRPTRLRLFLLGLTLPFEGVIVPLYYEIRGMGLLNTRWAIILPLIGLFMPFGVFWMRAHFLNMPRELSEAARIDGASTWQLFWQVHVPLAGPASRRSRSS